MNCIIIYQKSNGKIFVRIYKNWYNKPIGKETSMGWKVLNVLYEYKGNYYQYSKYMRLLRQDLYEKKNVKRFTRKIKAKICKYLAYKLRKMQQNLSYYI